jgi:hypothetical protein
MNSSVPRSFIDAHMADDPARAQAEYLAQFRTDVEGFVSPAIVEASVGDFHEMLPMAGFVYSGFVDPSGGSDAAMTLAIGHKTTTAEKQIVIDVIREIRPPFDPVAVVDSFAALLKTYRISSTQFDRVDGVPALPAQASSVRRPTSGLKRWEHEHVLEAVSSVSTKPAGEIGSTTARSADEVALIRDTISHYAPVLIAPLSIRIRRAGVQKNFVKAAIATLGPENLSRSGLQSECDELIDKGAINKANSGLYTSGAGRVHPVIVGWSTRNRQGARTPPSGAMRGGVSFEYPLISF